MTTYCERTDTHDCGADFHASPAPASQPTPTEADRSEAALVMAKAIMAQHIDGASKAESFIQALAQALADRTAELVARYEAVAAEVNSMPPGSWLSDVAVVGWNLAAMEAAMRIRQVGQ